MRKLFHQSHLPSLWISFSNKNCSRYISSSFFRSTIPQNQCCRVCLNRLRKVYVDFVSVNIPKSSGVVYFFFLRNICFQSRCVLGRVGSQWVGEQSLRVFYFSGLRREGGSLPITLEERHCLRWGWGMGFQPRGRSSDFLVQSCQCFTYLQCSIVRTFTYLSSIFLFSYILLPLSALSIASFLRCTPSLPSFPSLLSFPFALASLMTGKLWLEARVILDRLMLYFSIILGGINIDVMQRLEQVHSHLQSYPSNSSPIPPLLWERSNRIIQAFEPHLSDCARELVRKEYRNILGKIVEARAIFKEKFKTIERDSYNKQSVDLMSLKIWEEFRRCLEEKLHEIVSSLLNELTDRLAKKISKVPDSNLIARSVRIYSSVMGSYQLKLSFLQRLSPNIRTLSYIEHEMMQRSGERELSNSIWVLLYIFSFAFVQMFGKYITRHEKGEVIRIIKATFVRNLAVVAGSIEMQEEQQSSRHELEAKLDGWIEEISKSVQ